MSSLKPDVIDHIKEFLQYNKLTNTLECLEAEIKTK
jgi:hypothetical protein